MQQQLFSIRTVPFGSLSERLYRIMRATARELGKRANLEIRGAQVELDRAVLEKLVGPLEHLLRNALDHGIEPRAAAHEGGQVRNRRNHFDGAPGRQRDRDRARRRRRGPRPRGRPRQRRVAQGRIAADAQPTDAQLIECIFQPGFSTASKVTQVSGRGIGMDVVRSEIMALGGRVEVSTRPGHGHDVPPVSAADAGGGAGGDGARRRQVVGASGADGRAGAAREGGRARQLLCSARVESQGSNYPFHYLPRLLGDPHQIPESTRNNPVLLLRSGQNVAAIHVDEMIGNQEVVVKNIGPQLARVSGIAGATVLGNGEVVLIINPVQLAQRADVAGIRSQRRARGPGSCRRWPCVQAGKPLVMIVDDSLTVRRITSRLLAREGFDVLTARDGVDALELLQTEMPDVILLDIEMPRMDGFEFTKTHQGRTQIRAHPDRDDHVAQPRKSTGTSRRSSASISTSASPSRKRSCLRHLREMLALTT